MNDQQMEEGKNKKRSLSDVSDESHKKLKIEENEEQVSVEEKKDHKEELTDTNKTPILRGKPKKMVMMLSFSGKGYFGMQRNHGVQTIEEDLLMALYKASLISHDRYEKSQLMHFQRAARTDKGVSAVRQIVSFKLPVTDNSQDIVKRINENLPPQIRVMGLKRATKNFDAKLTCDARIYSYVLPTYSFSLVEEKDIESYRIPENTIDEINKILKMFQGTHNFHNFTAGKKPTDASAKRYIILFECEKPFVEEGLEFITIKIKGQSFMLHQIRKMVGLTIAIVRGTTDLKSLERCWGPDRIDIPIAPSIGLMLEEVCYERYNKKYGNDGIHEPLLWTEFEEDVNTFKKKFIYPTIIDTEKKENLMLKWLSMLGNHTYSIRDSSIHHENLLMKKEEKIVGDSSTTNYGENDTDKEKPEVESSLPEQNLDSAKDET